MEDKQEKIKIFIINGTGGSGKDTFVNFCIKWCKQRERKYVYNVSSVDNVKEAAKILGWNGSKDDKDRKFLSDLKQMSIEFNDGPFNYIKNRIEYIRHNLYGKLELDEDSGKLYMVSNDIVIFLHIREPEEIDRAVKYFNAKTILVKNDRIKCITTNLSDARVNNYEYDIIIDNSGSLSELEDKAIFFMETVLL